ncbi:MAG: hypothetical protein IAF08_03485 [Rhizobacter sp.]|nr:hypothetical protein [Chlorobiales bacterium]
MKVLILFCAAGLLIAGCKSKPSLQGKASLMGNWAAVTAQAVNHDGSTTGLASLGQFAVEQYGTATLSFLPESRFTGGASLVKDIVLTQEVLGAQMKRIALMAPQQFTCVGYYEATDTSFAFFDDGQNKWAKGAYRFEGDELHLDLQDSGGNRWLTVWQKQP